MRDPLWEPVYGGGEATGVISGVILASYSRHIGGGAKIMHNRGFGTLRFKRTGKTPPAKKRLRFEWRNIKGTNDTKPAKNTGKKMVKIRPIKKPAKKNLQY